LVSVSSALNATRGHPFLRLLRPEGVAALVARVEAVFPRLTALVIGPGLGRDPDVLEAVAQLLAKSRAFPFPVVVDADGLWLLQQAWPSSSLVSLPSILSCHYPY
jgi:NAD(P)H-hydrate repair Nnr-like enzyme with NAD(P)H-hydrate dehydratase domain